MAIKSQDQITIVDVTDAYSVMLESESYTFMGGISGVAAGVSTSTRAMAWCGTNQCSVVNVNVNDITCPTGISAAVTGSGTNAVTITFTVTATINSACEATIPVVVDGITVNKKFSFAVALKGATGETGAAGKGISGVTNYYLASASATGVTTSTTGWTTDMQTTDTTKKYLWCYQKIAYTSGNPTNTIPVIIGTHGATGATGGTGATGKGISSVTNKYLTTSAGSGVTTSTSGWADSPTATTTTNKYIWCYQIIKYTDNSTSNTVPAIIGTHGATGQTGAAGADAITVSVTASNGTVFKNSSGSTVLTAHVYKGGVEQTVADNGSVTGLGSVKWYVGGALKATAKTYTVSASAVTNTMAITCQLEG